MAAEEGVDYEFFALAPNQDDADCDRLMCKVDHNKISKFYNDYQGLDGALNSAPGVILKHNGIIWDILKGNTPSLPTNIQDDPEFSGNDQNTPKAQPSPGTGQASAASGSGSKEKKGEDLKAYERYKAKLDKLTADARTALKDELGPELMKGITIDPNTGEVKVEELEETYDILGAIANDNYTLYKFGLIHNSLRSVLIACDAN